MLHRSEEGDAVMVRYLLAQRVGDQYLTMPQAFTSFSQASAVISGMLDQLVVPTRIHSDGTIDRVSLVLPLVLLDLSSVPVVAAEEEPPERFAEELDRLIFDDPFLHAVYQLGCQRGNLEAEDRLG